MMQNTDRLIEIIEDHNSMTTALRMIMEALETKVLPSYGTLPTFNDTGTEDDVMRILEMATGKSYGDEEIKDRVYG